MVFVEENLFQNPNLICGGTGMTDREQGHSQRMQAAVHHSSRRYDVEARAFPLPHNPTTRDTLSTSYVPYLE